MDHAALRRTCHVRHLRGIRNGLAAFASLRGRAGSPLACFFSRLLVLGLLLQTVNAVVSGNEDPLGIGGVRMEGRVALIQKLGSIPGKHLVFARYSKDHNVHDEWVYNDADIEGSRIVWARELDAAQNQKLIEHSGIVASGWLRPIGFCRHRSPTSSRKLAFAKSRSRSDAPDAIPTRFR